MNGSTEQWLSTELERLVAQRERYALADKAATSDRAKNRHGRNLQRLEEEILGLREALGSLASTPVESASAVTVGIEVGDANDVAPAVPVPGAPQILLKKIESWPIDTPPVVEIAAVEPVREAAEEITDQFDKVPAPRSIVEVKAPRQPPPPIPARATVAAPAAAPRRTSGLFSMPTALPVPRALAHPEARLPRAARWPEPLGARAPQSNAHARAEPSGTTALPSRREVPAAPAATVSTASTVAAEDIDDLSTLEPRRVATEAELDADDYDAVLLRRRIARQAAKVMGCAFAIGFVAAAVVFGASRPVDAVSPDHPARTGIEPVLASTKN